MKNRWRRITMGLAFASCVAMVGSACVVTAKGRVRTRVVVVDDTNPPPKPKYRRVAKRPGQTWVRGRWVYRTNRWVWTAGSWQRTRADHRWEPGHWEKRARNYHWVDGRWVVARAGGGVVVRDHRRPKPAPLAYPTAAPPSPKYVTPGTRSGYVWVRGKWDWRASRWAWTPGHWERARTGHKWTPGHWKHRGDRYVWTKGSWLVVRAGGGGGVVVRDHRRPKVLPYPTAAPPTPRYKKVGVRAGKAWVRGSWQWRSGKWAWKAGHWQRAKSGHGWTPGQWQHRGDRYIWVKGSWKAGVKVRDHRKKKAPPTRKNERVKAKRSR